MTRPVEASVQPSRNGEGRTVVLRIKDGNQVLTYVMSLTEWGRLNADAHEVP